MKERVAFMKRKKQKKTAFKQVNNIVADGWAGASNPHPNPTPTHKHSQKVSKTPVFPLFNSITMDQRTNGQTKPLIELCPQLKKKR